MYVYRRLEIRRKYILEGERNGSLQYYVCTKVSRSIYRCEFTKISQSKWNIGNLISATVHLSRYSPLPPKF